MEQSCPGHCSWGGKGRSVIKIWFSSQLLVGQARLPPKTLPLGLGALIFKMTIMTSSQGCWEDKKRLMWQFTEE
jgi:hypothetical protein